MHSRLAPGLILLCGLALASAAQAGERLQLADDRGQPIAAPLNVCALHLAPLGLPPATDGSGHVLIAGLAPGDYDLFVATFSSEETVAAGLADGFLTSVSLAPLTDTELRLTVSSPGSHR